MEIVAENDTFYLVVTGKETSRVTTQGKDGTIVESEQLQTQYGVIAKDDYWSGTAAFQAVERSDTP